MKKNKIKSILVVIIILTLNFLGVINSVYATNLNSANIYSVGDCGQLLTYKGTIIKVSYVQYIENGISYPAYCLDKTKPGAETNPYTVSVQDAIQDVGLWRIIINGYPYKTLEELAVTTKQEAFTATKQAVYCYIHGNNPNDYAPIGEAGQRTLNAMKKIIKDAENSDETKISSTIKINKNESEWKQDNINTEYVSKTYSVSAGTTIEKYKITLTKENGQNIEGIKLTDEANQEKEEFMANENFKILIPIKSMTKNDNFSLKAEAKIKTKPVLYGKSPNTSYQDYALTAATFEDGIGTIKDEYYKNDTKIIIIKKDQETGELLKGVEFELLDDKEKVVYTGLKTDENGKIEINNIIPGVYYLKEINAIDGYIDYKELIKIEVGLNEELTLTVNNRKEEPKIEVKKTKNNQVKKLPVTGM